MLAVIEDFIVETRQNGTMSFDELYFRLTSAEGKIGLRKGLIPIYLAAVMHEYKREVIISDQFGQVALSAETLLQIDLRAPTDPPYPRASSAILPFCLKWELIPCFSTGTPNI